MATYPATNDLAALDPTNPTSTEDAGKTDDALRETRLVLKTAVTLAHSTKGEQVCALWAAIATTSPVPGPSGSNAWHTRGDYARLANIGGLDTSNNPALFVPVAGTYLLYADALGYKIDRFQLRLYNVTDGVAVPNCTGNDAYSPNGSGDVPTATATLVGIFTTDGTKTYRIEQAFSSANTTSGYGMAGGSWPSVLFRTSQVLMLKIG